MCHLFQIVRWIVALAIACAVAMPALGQDWKAISQILEKEQSSRKIPGFVAGVYWRGQIAWLHAGGLAELSSKRKVQLETPFRTGSIAKSLTAVGLLRLLEEGKLNLEDEIHRYCPAFPPKPNPIEVRQLLGHLGGIRHYRDEADRNNRKHYASVVESLSRFGADPLIAEPGEVFRYSTYGYSLAGCAMEGAAGTSYWDWMRQKVLGPAGMSKTALDDGTGISAQRAAGYRLGKGGVVENCAVSDNTAKIPGGGWVATVGDLLRFADALYRGKLLSKDSMSLMWSSGQLRSGQLTGYGLGWNLSRSPDGDQEIFHAGEQQGASAMLYLRPEKRFAFVWLANLEGIENRVPMSRRVYRFVSGR